MARNGRHEGLVRYLVSNFDGAEGGENWMRRLGQELARKNRHDLIRRLYRPAIIRRQKHYFWLKPRWPMPDFITSFLNHVRGERIGLAKYKSSVLALMQDYREATAAVKDADLSAIDHEIDAFARGEAPMRQPVAIQANRK